MNVSVSLSWRWTDEWVLSFCRAARGDPASRVLNQHAVGVVLGLTGAHWRPPQSGGRQRATVSPRWASWTSRQTWGADRGAVSLEAKPDTHQASGYNISSTGAPNQSHWNKTLSSSSESARKLMNKENLLRFASLKVSKEFKASKDGRFKSDPEGHTDTTKLPLCSGVWEQTRHLCENDPAVCLQHSLLPGNNDSLIALRTEFKKRQWLCFLCHIFKVMPQTLNFWKQNFARLFLLRQHHLWFSLNLQVQRGVTKSPKWKSVRDQIQPAYSFTYLCYILKTQWNKICFPVKLQRPAGVCSDFQFFKCG